MKKFLRILAMLVLILVISAGVFFWWLSRTQGGIETWIGAQLKWIVNSRINPTLAFDQVKYTYPGTVDVDHLRLTANDPTNPGHTVDLIACDHAKITLAEIPKAGKTLVIEKIIFDKPVFQAIATTPEGTDFVGLNDMVKSDSKPDEPDTGPDRKLSEIFKIKLIQLNDGKIVYNPRIEGTEPMTLDHIWTELDVQPSLDGTYDLKLGLNREPIFNLKGSTRFNLDDLAISNTAIQLTANVGRDKDTFLPPQLQKILQKYQVQGHMDLQVTGGFPFKDFRKGNVNLNAVLTDAFVTAGDYKLPVKRANIEATMQDGKVVVPVMKIDALKGSLSMNGLITLNDTLDSDLQLQVQNMVIDELFVEPGTAEKPKLAGRIKANINADVSTVKLVNYIRAHPPLKSAGGKPAEPATAPSTTQPLLMMDLPEKWGAGEIHLDHGRLVDIPVLDQLASVVGKTVSLLTLKRHNAAEETADVDFVLTGDEIGLPSFDYRGDFVGAHGEGVIKLDQRLDLLVNAGRSSNLVTTLTDFLLTYHVHGTVQDPKFDAQTAVGTVAGATTGAVKDVVGGGAKETEKGFKKGWNWIFGGDK